MLLFKESKMIEKVGIRNIYNHLSFVYKINLKNGSMKYLLLME